MRCSDGFVVALFRNGTARTDSPQFHPKFPSRGESGSRTDYCLIPVVIWFYERKGEHLRCEIRHQIEGDRFALVVTLPDGTERTEWFNDSHGLTRRSVELEKQLHEKGWNGPFARDI